MEEQNDPCSSGIPGWVLLAVAAVVTTVDLALTYWIAHWLLRWI